MRLVTRFGTFEVEESMIINFPRGILGFEGQKKYIILDHPGIEELKWLQSVEAPEVALPLIITQHFFPDYRPKVSRGDLIPVEIEAPEDALVLSVITVPQNPREITVNLKAPIIINPDRRLGYQVVLDGGEYRIREPLSLDKTPDRGRCNPC